MNVLIAKAKVEICFVNKTNHAIKLEEPKTLWRNNKHKLRESVTYLRWWLNAQVQTSIVYIT